MARGICSRPGPPKGQRGPAPHSDRCAATFSARWEFSEGIHSFIHLFTPSFTLLERSQGMFTTTTIGLDMTRHSPSGWVGTVLSSIRSFRDPGSQVRPPDSDK